MNVPPLPRRTVTARALLAASLMGAVSFGIGAGGCSSTGQPSGVSGRYILAISDADMPATAIFDGRLAPDAGDGRADNRDSLTVIGLPLVDQPDATYQTPFAQLMDVSNSVLGPPNSIAVSRDGTRAYVIETRGPAAPGAAVMGDLPAGSRLTAVDLSDPLKPSIQSVITIGADPLGVDIDPAGELVAVVTAESRQQLVIVPVSSAGMGEPLDWPFLGLDNDENVYATCVQWSPRGSFIAVTLPARDEVVFYRVARDPDGAVSVSPWGEPVKVGKAPYSGRFTPDGRYFITSDMHWDMSEQRPFMTPQPGGLSVVRFDDSESGTPRHELVGSAPVGVNPEGLAISPDGRLVVTSNFQQTFLPDANPDARPGDTRNGSLSLLSLDKNTGKLTPGGEYPIAGMPAGLSFDARGGFVVVTQFRSFDPGAVDGVLAFWTVHAGSTPSLERAPFTVGVGKGPQGVLMIR